MKKFFKDFSSEFEFNDAIEKFANQIIAPSISKANLRDINVNSFFDTRVKEAILTLTNQVIKKEGKRILIRRIKELVPDSKERKEL